MKFSHILMGLLVVLGCISIARVPPEDIFLSLFFGARAASDETSYRLNEYAVPRKNIPELRPRR